MLGAAAAFLAWLGASILVLADGRRGLGLGIGLAALGLDVLAWQYVGWIGGVAILAAGAVAAVQRVRSDAGDWKIMPPGSTPRLVLCIAGGLVVVWFAVSVTTGAGAALRFAVITVAGLAGARVLSSTDVSAALTSTSALALDIAVAASLGSNAGPVPSLAGAVIAAAVTFLPLRKPNAG